MDPEATLKFAEQCVSDLDFDGAAHALADYAHWRARGGYQPTVYGDPGDLWAKTVQRRLDDARAQS